MKINRNSFWYALFSFPNFPESNFSSMNSESKHGKTLCSFFWRTIYNIIVYLCVSLVIGILLGLFIGGLLTHTMTILSIIAIFIVIIFISKYNLDHKYDERPKKEPGIIKTMYKSIKDKYCPLIEFTNEKD